MQSGVYRKVEGRTGVGQLYEFACLCRHHTTGEQMVVYVPLRVEPGWAGTVRHCVLGRAEFERKFVHVGEGLPGAPVAQATAAPLAEVYAREECPFHYCDDPGTCAPADACRHARPFEVNR